MPDASPVAFTDPAGVVWRVLDWLYGPPELALHEGRAVPPGEHAPGRVAVRLFVRAPATPEDAGRTVSYCAGRTGDDPTDLSPAMLTAQLVRALPAGCERRPGEPWAVRDARCAADRAWCAATYAAHPAVYVSPPPEQPNPAGRRLSRGASAPE